MVRSNEMKPAWTLVARAACVVCFAVAGVVVGFCAGGLLGPLVLGSRGGHGMADLGYLFTGAILGSAGGAALGLLKANQHEEAARALRAGGLALLAASTAALLTFVWVKLRGGW
jgi:hypothetical protein